MKELYVSYILPVANCMFGEWPVQQEFLVKTFEVNLHAPITKIQF